MAKEFNLLVNSVVEALNEDECKMMMFLASDLLSGQRPEDDRAALITIATSATQSHSSDTIIMELLFHMKRFDILRRIMGKNRKQVEEGLKSGGVISPYRVLMLELSEGLEVDEFHSLIFLLNDKIPKSRVNQICSFMDIVCVLEERDEISSSKLDLIEECLRNIRRNDLIKKIQAYNRVCNTVKVPVCENTVQENQGLVEYNMNYELKGVCVIIDCIGRDGVLLKDTFERLGFVVFPYTLSGEGEVFSILKSLSQNSILQRAAVFICFLLCMDTHVFSTNAQSSWQNMSISGSSTTSVNTLTQLMEMYVQCVMLQEKPKLFFTQTLRLDQELVTDSVPFIDHTANSHAQPSTQDVLWSACETNVQNERYESSVFLQFLSSSLLEANRRLHVLDVLMEVERKILQHNQMNPDKPYHITLTHSLRKALYL